MEDGVRKEAEEREKGEEEEEEDYTFEEHEVAAKFIRVLTQEEGNLFVIFIEVGVQDRNCQLLITNEKTEIELTYRIPLPSDELYQAAGLHATQVQAEETFEVFYYKPTKRLTGKKEQINFPLMNPTWVIFKYTLEDPEIQEPIKMNVSSKNLNPPRNNNPTQTST